MSAVFKGARFAQLWRSHWAENRRSYAWFAGVAAMTDIAAIIQLVVTGTELPWTISAQFFWYFGGLFITGMVFAYRHGQPFSHAGATLLSLMRPASAFEKWLLCIAWVGLLYPLAYTCLYTLIHLPITSIAENIFPDNKEIGFFNPFQSPADQNSGIQNPNPSVMAKILIFWVFTSLQAFLIGGRYFFHKSARHKTSLLAFFLLILLFSLSSIINISFFSAYEYWFIPDSQRSLRATLVASLWLLGIPALLWAAVYQHLRERELS